MKDGIAEREITNGLDAVCVQQSYKIKVANVLAQMLPRNVKQ